MNLQRTRELAKWFRDRTDDILVQVAQRLVDDSKQICPVGQYKDGRVGGRLRGSISWSGLGDEGIGYNKEGTDSSESDTVSMPVEDHTIWVGTAVEYAPYVEFGTGSKQDNTDSTEAKGKGGQAAQPFLRPIAATAQDRYNQIIKNLLKRNIGK